MNAKLNRSSFAVLGTMIAAVVLASATLAQARTIIRLESCKDAAAVFAAGQAEEDASSSQALGVRCNSNYSKIQKLDDNHYQVQVSCVDSSFKRSYQVAVKRKGEFCGGTSAKSISFTKEIARK